MNRSNYFNYIEEHLNILSYRITERGKLNILDLNIYSETFFADLLNILFGFNLQNMNVFAQNIEAIDLVDEKNQIIAQISATCTKQKVESSLGKNIFIDYPGYRFKFVSIAKDATNLKKENFQNPNRVLFTPRIDVIDISTMLNTILSKHIDEQKRIYEFIKKELGTYIVGVGNILGIIRSNFFTWFDTYKGNNRIDIDVSLLPDVLNKSGEVIRLSDMLNMGSEDLPVVLTGDGGIGKSYLLFNYCSDFQRNEKQLALYIPLRSILRTDKSPILQFAFDHFFQHLDWNREANTLKQHVRDMLTNENAKMSFLLDGFNEYIFDTTAEESKTIYDEIRWLQAMNNIEVLVSSRSTRGFETSFCGKVSKLNKERVLDYLGKHKNTSDIDFSALRNRKLIELLQVPLMLALFTKTFSPTSNTVSIENVQKHSDILALCVEHQKNKFRNSKTNYALDILLPLIAVDSDMKLSFDEIDFAKQVLRELVISLGEEFNILWLRKGNEYGRINVEALSMLNEITLFNDLIGDTLLDNALFLLEYNDTISWQHELLMDWFAAKGIVINLECRQSDALSRILEIAEKVTKFDVRADELLPIALFIVEMIEDCPIANSEEFVQLLSALARYYHGAKDSTNIYKFAVPSLQKMDAGQIGSNSHWKFADLMNHVAYTLLSVSKDNMPDDFDESKCAEYARQHFEKALSIICDKKKFNKAELDDMELSEAQIYGNLGAYCLKMRSLTKDKEWVHKAITFHEQGLEARVRVLGDNPDIDENCGLIGTSYGCLATDYFWLDDNVRSLDNHRKAISYREKDNTKDIRKVESYTRCIGALNRLLSSLDSETPSEHLEEMVVLYQKALKYPECFRKNRSELRSMIKNFQNTTSYLNANRKIAEEVHINALKDVAKKLDMLCDDLAEESDLRLLIHELKGDM